MRVPIRHLLESFERASSTTKSGTILDYEWLHRSVTWFMKRLLEFTATLLTALFLVSWLVQPNRIFFWLRKTPRQAISTMLHLHKIMGNFGSKIVYEHNNIWIFYDTGNIHIQMRPRVNVENDLTSGMNLNFYWFMLRNGLDFDCSLWCSSKPPGQLKPSITSRSTVCRNFLN